jgi:hypothetical protein
VIRDYSSIKFKSESRVNFARISAVHLGNLNFKLKALGLDFRIQPTCILILVLVVFNLKLFVVVLSPMNLHVLRTPNRNDTNDPYTNV